MNVKESIISFVKEHKVMLFSLIAFFIITFPVMITHYPFFDESHAWMIAGDMNISNVVSYLKMEGHTILWYLVIMPFAKNDLFYPYSMLLINYIFCLSALIVMWLNAPFDNKYKVVITFSSMVLSYYAIIARCYSIGILFLFLTLSLYKVQLKKPLLYSILIVLTAHTNLLCAISASAFGLIFMYKAIKAKIKIKDIIISLSIFAFFSLLWIFPFLGLVDIYGKVPLTGWPPGFQHFRTFFLLDTSSKVLLAFYIINFLFILVTPKNISSKFYLLYFMCIIFIFMKYLYPMHHHHFLFWFVNIIVAYWILKCEDGFSVWVDKCFFTVFLIMLFFPVKNKISFCYMPSLKPVADFINIYNLYDDLYINHREIISSSIAPFLKNKSRYFEVFDVVEEDIPEGKYFVSWHRLDYPIVYEYFTRDGENIVKCYIYKIER